MGRPRKEELRELKEEERQELKRVVKATSERIDAIKRAKALLAVTAGATLTVAGQEAGLSREAVAQMVKRFNAHGLAYERAAGARADRSATRAGSRKGSDGHLVAAAATGCSAQDGSSPDRCRNDSGGAA